MSNYAWVLEVRPGYEDEYKKRHDYVVKELNDIQVLHAERLMVLFMFFHRLLSI